MKRIAALLFAFAFLFAPRVVAQGEGAGFYWDVSSITIPKNSDTSVLLSLDTAGVDTAGADIVLSYDTSSLEITGVTFSTPSLYAQNFSHISEGTIRITSTMTDVSSSFKGSAGLARITFKAIREGTTALTWKCQSGATNDTNIIAKTGNDIVNCARLTPFTIYMNSEASTATPTPTPTAGPQNCTAPAMPTNLRATAISGTSVVLQWDKGTNATYYTLKYGTSPNNYTFGASNMGDTNKFQINYLSPNTTYYFAVAGVNACYTTEWIITSTRTGTRTGGTVTTTTGTPSKGATPTASPAVLAASETIPSFETLVTPKPTSTVMAKNVEAAKEKQETATKQASPFIVIGLGLFLILTLLVIIVLWLQRRRTRNEEPPTQPVAPPQTPTV